MSKVCPYCETVNKDEEEKCTACGVRFHTGVDFNQPIREMNRLATNLLQKKAIYPKDYLENAYKKIMESVQVIMDQTMFQISDNLKDLKKIQEETRQDMEDEDFASFREFMAEFEIAQKQINQGLALARDSFFKTQSFEDLQKAHPDFSTASAIIQDGLSKMESLVIRSSDPEIMTLTPIDIPQGVTQSLESIEKAISHINTFTETGERARLENAAEQLEIALDFLADVLETYKEPSEETEEEMEEV